MSISDWTGGGSIGFGGATGSTNGGGPIGSSNCGGTIGTTNCAAAGGTFSASSGVFSLLSELFCKELFEDDFLFCLDMLLLLVAAGLTASISMSSESSELSESLSEVFMTELGWGGLAVFGGDLGLERKLIVSASARWGSFCSGFFLDGVLS